MKSLLIFFVCVLFFTGCKKADQQNVLLITVDGLRTDMIGCYGGGGQTRTLDQLAAAGVRFDRLLTPVPLSLPAHASLLTGANPPEHGLRINGFGKLPPAIATLAQSFGEAKYATAAFVGSPHLAAQHGLNQGFGIYEAPPVPAADAAFTLYVPLAVAAGSSGTAASTSIAADKTAARFGAWLAGLKPKTPWFAWVQFADTALPRHSPDGTVLAAADIAGYQQTMARVDAAIKTVLESVEATDGACRTIVMVTASAGESFGEKNEYGHGLQLNAVTRRVPGLLRLPGGQCAGARLPFSTSLVQIAPTLLDLAHVRPGKVQAANWAYMRWLDPLKPYPIPDSKAQFYTPCRSDSLAPLLFGYFQGMDSAVYCESEYGYALLRWQPQRALQVGNWIYIKRDQPELYDLNSDPAEAENLAPALPDSVERLDVRLDRLMAGMAKRPPIDVTASNAAWRVMTKLGASGVSPDIKQAEQSRLRIGLTPSKKEENAPALDADLAMQVFKLYPLLAATNRAAETFALLDDAIALSPATARFYVWRAMLRTGDTNELDSVVADLTQAATLEPQNPEVCAMLGKAYFDQNNAVAALAQLRQARRFDPKNEIVADLLAQVLYGAANEAGRRDDAGDALRLVEELLVLQPTLDNRMWRVRLLISRQRNTQARQELRNILYANPDYFPARDLLDRLR